MNIRREGEYKVELRENMRGGDGTVQITNFTDKEALCEKARLFGKITLQPGCSIGYHVHEGDCEIFHFVKGSATYNDNGTEITVKAGDTTVTPSGSGHSVRNDTNEPCEMIALIVYA
jgi:quercetin dioxygenase-like cupin family protein